MVSLAIIVIPVHLAGCIGAPSPPDPGMTIPLSAHPLESRRPLNAPSIPSNEMPQTTTELVEFLAPELTEQIVDHDYSFNAFSRTTAVRLVEAPASIAPGVCRRLSHVARASHRPGSDGPRTDFFGDLTTHVGFFAGAVDLCEAKIDQPEFWASSDHEATEALEIARAVLRGVGDGSTRLDCEPARPDCHAVFDREFRLDALTQAGRCFDGRGCHAFHFGPWVATVHGGMRARRVELGVSPPPPPE